MELVYGSGLWIWSMDLAYGERGIPAKITARPMIIDEIECITERNVDGHQEVPR